MPRRAPQTAIGADIVELLLVAAERVLAEDGLAGLTTNRCAKVAITQFGIGIGDKARAIAFVLVHAVDGIGNAIELGMTYVPRDEIDEDADLESVVEVLAREAIRLRIGANQFAASTQSVQQHYYAD